jgi:hypothetical protein
MTKEKSIHYKEHVITVKPLDELCSSYSYVIKDNEGNEIKQVRMGGDTEEVAVENAKKMINFEFDYAK